jgi:hypothetical protein
MNQLKDVLERHGKVNGFGATLLARHFQIDPDLRKERYTNRAAKSYEHLHRRFLTSLLRNGYAVLANAIENKVAQSLVWNYEKSVGYAPSAWTIRKDIGIGTGKSISNLKSYGLAELMEGLYEIIRPAAQVWVGRMEFRTSFPRKYVSFQKRCEKAGQNDPAAVFRYKHGSYVRFHSDPPGKIQFPFQFLGLLSDHTSFSGGDFLLRRRANNTSSIIRVKLQRGDILVFPVGDFKDSKSGPVESWQHAVGKLKRSERFSISFLLNQDLPR